MFFSELRRDLLEVGPSARPCLGGSHSSDVPDGWEEVILIAAGSEYTPNSHARQDSD
jgi:hypothetical protein